MAYQSGEFVIGGLDEGFTVGSAAAVFNNTVFYLQAFLNTGPEPPMHVCGLFTFDLQKLIRTGSPQPGEDPIDDTALKTRANWKVTLPLTPQNTFYTAAQPALAATADTLYAFLNTTPLAFRNGPPHAMSAYLYTLPQNTQPGQPGSWGTAISLMESDKSTFPKPASQGSGMSATLVGENIMIVTCSAASSTTDPAGGTYVGVYDTTEIDTDNNTWAAQQHLYLPLQATSGLNPENAVYVWTEWYASSGANKEPDYTLACIVESNSTPLANIEPDYYCWNLKMTVSEKVGKTSVTLTSLSTSESGGGYNNAPSTPFIFSSLQRDPGGRLRLWACTPPGKWSKEFSAMTTATETQPLHNGFGGIFYNETLQVSYANAVEIPPVSLFYVFDQGKSETTVNGKQADQYPVYEFVFYSWGWTTCQVVRCGTIQVIPGFSQRTSAQRVKDLNIIAGIIDGPMPLPIENYQGQNLGSTYEAGAVTYGTTDSHTTEREVSNSWTVGFETSGKATSGVGPAWDISFDGGMGSVSRNSAGTSLAYGLEQKASISFDEHLNATLDPNGALRKVGVQFTITAFTYLNNFGPGVDSTNSSKADALKPASVLTTMITPGALNFKPFAVEPGDLMSYTPEKINEKMKSLGYHGDNYYGDVLCTNAYPFGHPNQPFLSFSLSPSSMSWQAFTQFTESYEESSWSLEGKFMVGVSGGTNIFGLESFEMEFLAGVGFSHESTESENDEHEWGIEVSKGWILPEGESPKSVASYDVRLFFLPVPTKPSTLTKKYWTEELMKYMPPGSETKADNIDPNSACWRITYAVIRIQYKDEDTYPTYTYDGSLDKPSVYTSPLTDDSSPGSVRSKVNTLDSTDLSELDRDKQKC